MSDNVSNLVTYSHASTYIMLSCVFTCMLESVLFMNVSCVARKVKCMQCEPR